MTSIPLNLRNELADFGYAEVSFLAEGASNILLQVDDGNQDVLLKISKGTQRNALRAEAYILEEFSGKHSPRLQKSFNLSDGRPAIAMDRRQGEHKQLLDSEEARQLAYALNWVHEYAYDETRCPLASVSKRTFFETRVATQYHECISSLPTETGSRITRICATLDHVIGIDGSTKYCIVHGDIIPLNLLVNKQEATLIDWELARIASPEWDIASIMKSFTFTDGAFDCFRDSYIPRIDESILAFVSALQYANVALWRLSSHYLRGEHHAENPIFLEELEQELRWLEERILRLECPPLAGRKKKSRPFG